MSRRRPRRWLPAVLVACLALGGAGAAVAQEDPRPRFQVEVLVFLQPEGISVELPPPLPQPEALAPGADAMAADAGEAAAQSPGADESAAPEAGLPAGFAPPLEPLQLENAAAALRRRGYVQLWHQAWIQPPADRDGIALPLLAALGRGAAQAGLDGTVSLTQGRFLHLGLDLRWQPGEVLEAELQQRRRLRTREEHYFDHPRLGVLAVVQPVD
jgi:hypothetical protein